MKRPAESLLPRTRRVEKGDVSELLLLPDGQILVHNLTPAMAAVLAEINPADAAMRERATGEMKSTGRKQSAGN